MEISKKGNIFISLYKSITDISYYKYFIHAKTKKAVFYLIIISMLFFLIGMIPNISEYKTTVDKLFDKMELLPYFEVKDGRFVMEDNKYHIVLEDKQSDMIVVLDPIGEYRRSDLDYYNVGVLLTETQLIQKTGDAVNTIDLSNFSMFTLTKDTLIKSFGSFFLSMIPLLMIYMLVIGIGVKFIACYIIYIISIIYVMAKRIDLNRSSIFRVCCHAVTLPIVIGSVLSLIGIHIMFWDMIFILIGFLYSYNSIKKFAKDNNLYIKLDEPL